MRNFSYSDAENAPEQTGRKWRLPVRYLMAIMGSIGLAIIYGFKVNVSVAIVAMVNRSALQQENLHENQSLAADVCGFSTENDTAKNSEAIFYFLFVDQFGKISLNFDKIAIQKICIRNFVFSSSIGSKVEILKIIIFRIFSIREIEKKNNLEKFFKITQIS